MAMVRLIRSELRKLTTTRMPWGFLAVLALVAAGTAAAVIWGTDADGSKDFVSTGADQQSLTAFASNAMLIAGLFGAMAVAREYAHGTAVATFLITPRRRRAVLAQYIAITIGGAVLGLAGAGLSVGGVALALPTTEYGFLMSGADVIRVLAAASLMGASGALFGAGIGECVRNTGGAVAGSVLGLLVVPPLVVQMIPDAVGWVPAALGAVLSGLGGDLGVPAAIAVTTGWGLVPALTGLVFVQKRDVV